MVREALAQGEQHGLAPGVLALAIGAPADAAGHCHPGGVPRSPFRLSFCCFQVYVISLRGEAISQHLRFFNSVGMATEGLFGFGSAGDEGMSGSTVGRELIVSFSQFFWGEMAHSFHPLSLVFPVFMHIQFPVCVIFVVTFCDRACDARKFCFCNAEACFCG